MLVKGISDPLKDSLKGNVHLAVDLNGSAVSVSVIVCKNCSLLTGIYTVLEVDLHYKTLVHMLNGGLTMLGADDLLSLCLSGIYHRAVAEICGNGGGNAYVVVKLYVINAVAVSCGSGVCGNTEEEGGDACDTAVADIIIIGIVKIDLIYSCGSLNSAGGVEGIAVGEVDTSVHDLIHLGNGDGVRVFVRGIVGAGALKRGLVLRGKIVNGTALGTLSLVNTERNCEVKPLACKASCSVRGLG